MNRGSMERQAFLKKIKKWHKWGTLLVSIFLFLFAVSGMIVNHRDLVGGIDIPGKYLPKIYRYHNWNMASVRGSVPLTTDTLLLYGTIGVWKTDTAFTTFEEYNRGFPEGADHRKVRSLVRTPGGYLYAGTLFGLFVFDGTGRGWVELALGIREKKKPVPQGEPNGKETTISYQIP